MSLDVSIRHRQGAFTLDAAFQSTGRLTALYGPSGSGKTTIINAIAGLFRPQEGRIAVDGTVLLDTEQGRFVPKHRRRIGYVFQEGRLFPHMNVRQNLLFGRWFTPRAERRAHVGHVVEMLGLEQLLQRRPAQLSGGEKQRVAIGRALLADPRLVLMDEPLSSLDEGRKAEIYPYIERLRDEGAVPIVYVSHSVAEIARLATSVVVLSQGRVVANGSAAEILPQSKLFPVDGLAEAGALIDTQVLRHEEAFRLTLLQARAGTLTVPQMNATPGTRVRARLRARDIILSLSAPTDISAQNILPGTVVALGEPDGPGLDVIVDCAGDRIVARITRQSAERLGLAPGMGVHAIVKSVAFDPEAIGQALESDRS